MFGLRAILFWTVFLPSTVWSQTGFDFETELEADLPTVPTQIDATVLSNLVHQLSATHFADRANAVGKLLELGPFCLTDLVTYATPTEPEAALRLSEVIEKLRIGLSLHADEAYHFAIRLRKANRTDEMLRVLNALTIANDQYPPAWYSLAAYHLEAGAYKAAINACEKFRAANPKDPSIHMIEGLSYLYWKKPAKAERSFNRLLKTEPQHIDAIHNRGEAHLAQNDIEAALKDFNTFIDAQPGNPHGYWHRAMAWHKKGEPLKALEDTQKAWSLGTGGLREGSALPPFRLP